MGEQVELVAVDGEVGDSVGNVADFLPRDAGLAERIDGSAVDSDFVARAVSDDAECPISADGAADEWEIGGVDFGARRKADSKDGEIAVNLTAENVKIDRALLLEIGLRLAGRELLQAVLGKGLIAGEPRHGAEADAVDGVGKLLAGINFDDVNGADLGTPGRNTDADQFAVP